MVNLSDNDIILLDCRDESDTLRFGEMLGGVLKAGCVVAIDGYLGAGKTCFVKGVAMGLGVGDTRFVTSPTFNLVNEYCGRVPVFHIDAYRLNGVEEMYDLGCDEMFWSGGVTVVEWAGRVEECLPDDIIRVDIIYGFGSEREIKMFSSGEESGYVLDVYRGALQHAPAG